MNEIKAKFGISFENISVANLCKSLIMSSLFIYLIFILFFNNPNYSFLEFSHVKLTTTLSSSTDSPTNLSHLVFGLLGSEKAWHQRKAYIETWWRPNVTRGYIFLDQPPTEDLFPWSSSSPPYKVSDDLTELLSVIRPKVPQMIRMVHGIMEVFREERGEMRWLVIGDDDSIFFVDNIVDALAKYDHTQYYYIGGQSEFILSNFWYSFNQGFGGAGYMLSHGLAKALVNDMENCLRRYAHFKSADLIVMACIADIGVTLSPHKGIHQIDLRGNISGLLTSHPQAPLISLHHFDSVEPIFPIKDRYTSAHHLMKPAKFDQSRMLQQTICHHRPYSWSFSISWGYSIHIYEKIMPRSWLQLPIETFQTWLYHPRPPHYMFNTRGVPNHPCESPHEYFFESVEKTSNDDEILTIYTRESIRGLSACLNESYSADYISTIEVFSPATKRIESGRCECCDIVHQGGSNTAKIKFRECKNDEIIA